MIKNKSRKDGVTSEHLLVTKGLFDVAHNSEDFHGQGFVSQGGGVQGEGNHVQRTLMVQNGLDSELVVHEGLQCQDGKVHGLELVGLSDRLPRHLIDDSQELIQTAQVKERRQPPFLFFIFESLIVADTPHQRARARRKEEEEEERKEEEEEEGRGEGELRDSLRFQ